jgi:putative ABC transport system permease protein
MRWILNRLKNLLHRQRQEQDLQDEVAAHLQMDAQERIDAGYTPDEARRAARRDFGNVLRATEVTRSTWGWTMLDQCLQDTRYSVRNLRRAPGFTLVTLLTLAIGIGANTAIFSIVNAVLLRPLPYPDADRLVSVFSVNPPPNNALSAVAPADFRDWREQATSFERLAAYVGGDISFWLGERPESVNAPRVTWDFFETLGVPPLLGRGFEQAVESTPTNNTSVVLSHGLWLSRFGGDRNIVGRQVKTATGSATVVGVMPSTFRFPANAEAWVPIGCCGEIDRRGTRYWRTVGRLREGQSIPASQAEIESISEKLAELYPMEDRNWSARIIRFDQALVRDVQQALWILMGAVAFVIVIACANIAGLMLVRSAARRREIGVRFALGANRWRLVQQLFIEASLVSMTGAVAGLLLAKWGNVAFFGLLPRTSWTPLARFREGVQLDASVLLFTALLSVLTAVVLTIVPVWNSLNRTLLDCIRAGAKRIQTRREHRLYKLLVVGQVSCAIVLLAGAGLLMQSFIRMLNIDNGYDPRGLVIMSLPQPLQARQVFIDQALQRINAVPVVESAAVISYDRFGGLNFPFNILHKPFPNGDVTARYSSVTPEYFRVLRPRLIAGRVFETRDSVNAPGVAVINEKLAREYFPNEDPIGRSIVLAYNNQRIPREVIGVISDIRQDAPGEPVKPEILVPWSQLPWLGSFLVVRGKGDPANVQRFVQEAIWSVDKNLPASRTETLEEILSSQVATPRLYMILVGLFATVAVVLAGLGIYGLLAYIVSHRTTEMAVRVAVGANTSTLLRLVIFEGIQLSAAGIFLGLLGTAILTRLMRSLLFEVSPTDPATLAGVALLLFATALAACYIPARRAAKTDPAVALRSE